ncbi:MAG: glycosyltransferase [SAR324 cluster bacterium]|uniref:Glycosyltransferase n=1 Tax=SAR324 cluster bacterium TaxID=2024889 RepID=A0A7X9FUP3_9DELT|nr:glycosyltransferase [SAR324 cluster bacterium]
MATLFLARYLAKTGRRVVVAGILDSSETTADGVEFWDLGPNFDVNKIITRARELGSYHLISAGRALPLFVSKDESQCVSRTLITHDRAGSDTGIKPEILCQIADHILCVSHAQARVFTAAGADPAKITVIHNGADLDLFQAADPEKRDYKRLIFVGALIQDKGIHLLINSFARLKNQFPELKLDVYGSADLWGREKLFDEQEIERLLPGIHFHGKTPQASIAKAYQEAGICVIPSIWFDPFPLVSLEAQVTGCPVLAFNVGGLGEGMLPGKTGLLVDEISEDALTKSLAELLSNPERLKDMSKEALSFARKTFTWERVVEKVTALCEGSTPKSHSKHNGLIGFLSTWNQQCGLATYGKYLATKLPEGTYVVLAEDIEQPPTAPDEPFVERCWKRGSSDFSRLLLAIDKYNIKLLHLNCQSRFFPEPLFAQFLKELQEKGIVVLAHLHNTFTLDQNLQYLVQTSDGVIVHTKENRMEAVANGAKAESTYVLPHGVDVRPERSDKEKIALRKKYSLPTEKKIITCFGFVQAHKGMEGMIEAVAHLRQKGIDALGIIAGRSNESDPSSMEYLLALKDFARKINVSEQIKFLDRFLDDEEVMEYLAASDIVMMNYRSNYFEASGACALAIGARAVVVTSLAPPFMCFEDAVFHITGGYPPELAVELLLSNDPLREEIKRRANAYCENYNWAKIGQKLLAIYKQFGFTPSKIKGSAIGKKTDTKAFELDGLYDMASIYPDYQSTVEKGELAAKEGNFELAHDLFHRAQQMSNFHERSLSSQAALYMAEGNEAQAKELFEEALRLSPNDARSLSGLGMCYMEEGNLNKAHDLFVEALIEEPYHLISINKLVTCAHSLGNFKELEPILRNYVSEFPENTDMQYCYAGCLYKLNRYELAADICDKLLTSFPSHQGAKELKDLLQKRRALQQVLGNTPSSREEPQEISYVAISESDSLKQQ